MAESVVLIAASGDDALAFGSAATYPPSGTGTDDAGTSDRVEKSFYAGPEYFIGCVLLRFATGDVIPDDATISSAVLRVRGTAKADTNSRSVTWEYYAFDGSVAVGDFTSTVGTDAHAGRTITSLSDSADEDFTLLNPDANIAKTAGAYTGLRGHVDGGSPGGVNYWNYATYDDATLPEPQLTVTYTIPSGSVTLRVVRSSQRW